MPRCGHTGNDRQTAASLGYVGLRLVAPEAHHAVALSRRPPAAGPGTSALPSTFPRGRLPAAKGRTGREAGAWRRRGTREPERGRDSDPIPENARVLQDVSNLKPLQAGSANFRATDCVAHTGQPCSRLQITHPPSPRPRGLSLRTRSSTELSRAKAHPTGRMRQARRFAQVPTALSGAAPP